MYDVIIIGGGIIGAATAHALCRYQLKTLLIEREADIAVGATKANSGILHAGYDCHPSTLKADLNVKGLAMYPKLCKELDIPYRANGSLVISTSKGGHEGLNELYKRGKINGVSDMELLTAEETLALEPNLTTNITGALRAKTAGIISPYEACIAFAENAATNGVEFLLETSVTGLATNKDGSFTVHTQTHFQANNLLHTKVIINAAGIESATIHNHVHSKKEAINPQRGQYYLLDNTQRDLVKHTIFQLPTNLGKGVLVVPTTDDNILIGPTAEPPENSNATETTLQGLQEVLEKTNQILKHVPIHDRITAFAGIRAKHVSKDFIIEESTPGFINAMGIDSPGLTAAPAIAEKIAGLVTIRLQPAINHGHKPTRMGIKRFRQLSLSQQEDIIKQNAAYGRIVCRCETITEAEIIDAINRPIGAKNLHALKRRTRAQMGRCQGGFCLTKLIDILSRELNIPETAITLDGVGSELCFTTDFP